jgi:hypothetical protein
MLILKIAAKVALKIIYIVSKRYFLADILERIELIKYKFTNCRCTVYRMGY